MSSDTEADRAALVAWAKETCASWARAADAADRAWEAAAHAIEAAQSSDAAAASAAAAAAKEKVAIAIVETRSASDISSSADAMLAETASAAIDARMSELDRLEQCRPDAGCVDFATTLPEMRVRRVRPQAVMPRYMTDGAAGLDLSAALERDMWLLVGQSTPVPTGLVVELPPGHEGQIRPRSGLAVRHGLTVLNAPGTIDSDYRGEVFVVLVNHGSESVRIEPGMRIAQLVVAPVTRVEVVEAAELSPTARGEGGFGSTG